MMMMTTHPMPQGVLLDMDGLMLDTERPVVAAWITAGRALGLEISPEIAEQTIGVNEQDTKALFLREYGQSFPYREARRALETILLEKIAREGIALRPGLCTLLDRLDSLAIPFGVATSTSRDIALWKLEKAGLSRRFKTFAFGDEVDKGKPAPDIFLLAASRLGVGPAGCVGFEDSPAGLESLRRAGIPSVFIKDMVEPAPHILASVWRRFDTLSEAAAALFSAPDPGQ
jgi:HAD superfamily hydrolase (TIGR01509 family)